MAKRQVSAATKERLRAMRERYGLGEYAKGDPFKGRRGRGGRPRGRTSAKPARKPRRVARRRPFAGGGGKSGGGGSSGTWGLK